MKELNTQEILSKIINDDKIFNQIEDIRIQHGRFGGITLINHNENIQKNDSDEKYAMNTIHISLSPSELYKYNIFHEGLNDNEEISASSFSNYGVNDFNEPTLKYIYFNLLKSDEQNKYFKELQQKITTDAVLDKVKSNKKIMSKVNNLKVVKNKKTKYYGFQDEIYLEGTEYYIIIVNHKRVDLGSTGKPLPFWEIKDKDEKNYAYYFDNFIDDLEFTL